MNLYLLMISTIFFVVAILLMSKLNLKVKQRYNNFWWKYRIMGVIVAVSTPHAYFEDDPYFDIEFNKYVNSLLLLALGISSFILSLLF